VGLLAQPSGKLMTEPGQEWVVGESPRG
jgi:hypothetical protein